MIKTPLYSYSEAMADPEFGSWGKENL